MSAVKIVRKIIPDNIEHSLPETLHPLLKRIYLARNITCKEQLDHSLKHLLPFHSLMNIDAAAALLANMASDNKKILVVGDFDADGATSCAVAMRALSMLGINNRDYLVPNRFEYGYGLTPEIVELAKECQPALIMTVDNGITSIEGVHAARQAGIDVLVTDHHLAGETLPNANVIVNPNQPGDKFPSKALAGVGVTFYIMLALRAHLKDQGWFEQKKIPYPNLGNLLDLVALGTVADVVPLDKNNRILVQQGLQRIRNKRCCRGIQALLEIARRRQERCVTSDLGFTVGPRLNAAGRIEHMSLGIECLLANDRKSAMLAAQRLDQLNKERRSIEAKMKKQALADLKDLPMVNGSMNAATICLFNPNWHQGVIGILASRVKDQHYRPTVVFAPDGDYMVKGSARSISSYHIRDAFARIAASHPDLIQKYGGHAMAAGLTLDKKDLDTFITLLESDAQNQLSDKDFHNIIASEGEINVNDMHLSIADLIKNAEPWGQNFLEPIFDGVFELVEAATITAKQAKLKLRLPNNKTPIDAITFKPDMVKAIKGVQRIKLAYRMEINDYTRPQKLRLFIEHIEAA